ncbi:MAG: hypothetical protein ACRD3S_09890 [Terracidiphilus sp.]
MILVLFLLFFFSFLGVEAFLPSVDGLSVQSVIMHFSSRSGMCIARPVIVIFSRFMRSLTGMALFRRLTVGTRWTVAVVLPTFTALHQLGGFIRADLIARPLRRGGSGGGGVLLELGRVV